MNLVLKALTGSRAHGFATEFSDWDWRGVFYHPTSAFHTLESKLKMTDWVEGAVQDKGVKADTTAWEIGHFLELAARSNPTVLEVFAGPRVTKDHPPDYRMWPKDEEWGDELISLFPYLWNKNAVLESFIGYGRNQRTKFLDNKDKRGHKYACQWLRTLCQADHLLRTGRMMIDFKNHLEFGRLGRWKQGKLGVAEVMETTIHWEEVVKVAAVGCAQQADLGKVNDFLLRFRQAHW